ncbi:MAG: lipopolysaccharide heptosyltransferase I [Gallionella sp.]
MGLIFTNIDSPRILLVKTSSLGDVLHNLPVVTDIVRHYPSAQIDWVVEEDFAALPKLHPAIHKIIPVSLRRWRGRLLSPVTWREIASFRSVLSSQNYDFAIDTQGLLKSALLMRGAHGLRCGFDKHSAREPLASVLYQRKFAVSSGQHAVERNRQLVAQALGYTVDGHADYGIHPPSVEHFTWLVQGSYAVLLHATSRSDKLWDESNWIALGQYLHEKRIRSVLPWGSEFERLRSLRLAAAIPGAVTPPRLSLYEAAALLGGALAVIGVDTGLAHLAAALNVSTIGIYTATDPALTGLHAGTNVVNLGGIGQTPDIAAVITALHGVSKLQ